MKQTIPLLILGMACQGKTGEAVLPECSISALEPGQLETDGTLVVDQHGRQILLRGINTGGRSKFAPFWVRVCSPYQLFGTSILASL